MYGKKRPSPSIQEGHLIPYTNDTNETDFVNRFFAILWSDAPFLPKKTIPGGYPS